MIILLNGPLGVGKSTFAEALAENMDHCVMLDGDHLVAANPPAPDEIEHLHGTIALLVEHHRRFGYRHFVVNHVWTLPEAIADLRRRLRDIEAGVEFHCFLLTLAIEENRRRIHRRQGARELDERAFEWRTVMEEREALYGNVTGDLGEPFDVSAPTAELVPTMLRRVGLRRRDDSGRLE